MVRLAEASVGTHLSYINRNQDTDQPGVCGGTRIPSNQG